MACDQCQNLLVALESAFTGYYEARKSSFFKISTQVAGRRLVDLERAKNDLIEHRLVCQPQKLESDVKKGVERYEAIEKRKSA